MFGKTDGATPHGKSAGVIPLATKLVRGVVFLDRELAGAGIGPSRNAAPTWTAKTCLVQALWLAAAFAPMHAATTAGL